MDGVPPKEEKKVEQINIKVVAQDGGEVAFKIKKTTPMRKVMEAYASKTGKAVNTVRFMFDGDRVKDDQTPEGLDMEDNDTIQASVEQIGGSF